MFEVKFEDSVNAQIAGAVQSGSKQTNIKQSETTKLNPVANYLSRNANKLILNGLSKPLSKSDFVERC